MSMGLSREEKIVDVLLAPVVSEKSTFVSEKNGQVVFRVREDANKADIKAAVELMFKVEVDAIQVVRVKGKKKRFGRTLGNRRNWKKAYVCLKPGQDINLVEGEEN